MIVASVLASFIILAGIFTGYQLIKSKVIRFIRAFVEPKTNGEQSPLADSIDNISKRLASSIIENIKMTELGFKRGAQKQEQAVEAAITKDIISYNEPLIGAALQMFPNLSKLANKNPQLAMAASQMIGNFLSQSNTGGNHPPENINKPKFNL